MTQTFDRVLGKLEATMDGLADSVDGLRREIRDMRDEHKEYKNFIYDRFSETDQRIRHIENWKWSLFGAAFVLSPVLSWVIVPFIRNIIGLLIP